MKDYSKIIDNDRYIRNTAINRLDVSNIDTETSHSHPNKPFLDDLNIDNLDRLTYQNEVLPLPVIQDDW